MKEVCMKQRLSLVRAQFNWRMLLVRLLVYALIIGLVAGLLPQIHFTSNDLWVWLMLAAGFGVLNAVVMPLLQALTLQLFFATYGLVVALLNALMLYLLARIFPQWFAVDSLLWALVGGLLIALLGTFLEGLFGLTRPIVPESEEELRRRLTAQDRGLIYTLFKARQPALASEEIPPQPPGVAPNAAPTDRNEDAPAGPETRLPVGEEAASAVAPGQGEEGGR
jgi:uncharacterized membrane protein YvlD (DUF360 family)